MSGIIYREHLLYYEKKRNVNNNDIVFDPRQIFNPYKNFMDSCHPCHPWQNFDPQNPYHPHQNFINSCYLCHQCQNLTYVSHKPTHPCYPHTPLPMRLKLVSRLFCEVGFSLYTSITISYNLALFTLFQENIWCFLSNYDPG